MLIAAATASAMLLAPPAGAVTVGADLNQTPAFEAGCGALLIPPQSCAFFDPLNSQTPPGRWRVTSARVRTGPSSGPMRITMIQALRSKSGAGGIICCTASSQGPVFTPPASSTVRVNLNLPAVNTTQVIDNEQIEVIDYLGISLMNQSGSIAFAFSQFGSTFFDGAFSVGETRLGGGLPSLAPMIRANLEACAGSSASGPSASATPCAPLRFSLSPRVRLLRNGKVARVIARVPRRGTLRLTQAGRGKTLIRSASSKAKKAGNVGLKARLNRKGKRVLKRRGRVKAKVRVRFKPNSGKASVRKLRVVFRR
jgi:hypothetical protein